MTYYKKTSLFIIIFTFLYAISSFANTKIGPGIGLDTSNQANIIYAPTKENKVDFSNDIEKQEDTYVDKENVYYDTTSEISDSTDYINTHLMVEIDGNYYCYENNMLAKKAWRKIKKSSFNYYGISTEGFNDDYIWMYFAANTKAVKGNDNRFKKIRIDNQFYAFNQYGQLLKGFFNQAGEMCDMNDTDNFASFLENDNDIYYSDLNTGIMITGWLSIPNNTDLYSNKNKLYFYFNPTSHKAIKSTSEGYRSITIGGQKYAFDNKGINLIGFEAYDYNVENGIQDSQIKFFSAGGNDSEGFIRAIPSENVDEERFEDEEELTYYLKKNGTIYKNIIKKIGSSYYGFDDKGVLIKNLSIWKNGNYIDTIDPSETDGKKFIMTGSYTNKDGHHGTFDSKTEVLHFFDKNGKRITNDYNIEFADDKYTYSATNTGATQGNKNKKYYQQGLLLKPLDSKYGILIDRPDKTSYSMSEIANNRKAIVVNTSGTKQTSKSSLKDDDENYWLVDNDGHLLNIYSVNVKRNGSTYYFKSEKPNGNSETWIPFGEKDAYGRTCVLNYTANGSRLSNGAIASYQVKPDKDVCINFNLS